MSKPWWYVETKNKGTIILKNSMAARIDRIKEERELSIYEELKLVNDDIVRIKSRRTSYMNL